MARVDVIPVRVNQHMLGAVKSMAKRGHIAPATLAYIALSEYLELHGYEPADEDDDSSLSVANAKKK